MAKEIDMEIESAETRPIQDDHTNSIFLIHGKGKDTENEKNVMVARRRSRYKVMN